MLRKDNSNVGIGVGGRLSGENRKTILATSYFAKILKF